VASGIPTSFVETYCPTLIVPPVVVGVIGVSFTSWWGLRLGHLKFMSYSAAFEKSKIEAQKLVHNERMNALLNLYAEDRGNSRVYNACSAAIQEAKG
jgi:hypothetical protein